MKYLNRMLLVGIAISSILFLIEVTYFIEFFYNRELLNIEGIEALDGSTVASSILILIFIIFNLITLKQEKETKVKFFTLIISFLFSVYTSELFLQIIKPVNIDHIRDGKSQIEHAYDDRVYKKNDESFPLMIPSHLLGQGISINQKKVLPISGISRVKTYLCNEDGKMQSYISDKYGFNNKKDLYDEKIDIALLGDSFTNGACVDYSDNIASKISKYSNEKVLNLGISGNGLLLELGSFVEYGARLKPSKIVWIYYEGNDLYDTFFESLYPEIRSYINQGYSQQLIMNAKEVRTKLIDLFDSLFFLKFNRLQFRIDSFFLPQFGNYKKIYNFFFLKELRFLVNKFISLHSQAVAKNRTKFDLDVALILVERTMVRAKNIVKDQNSKMYIVFIPNPYRHFKKGTKTEVGPLDDSMDSYYKKDVLGVFEKLNLPVFDFTKVIHGHGDFRKFYQKRRVNHYSKFGYDELAKFTLESIKEFEADVRQETN